MTEDNTTETTESEGNESNSGEENDLIKSLRQQLKDKDSQLKAQPSASEIEAQIRASVAREGAIEQQLVAAGQPTGLRPLVEEKLGEADVTPEGVVEALKAIGFEITESDDSGTEGQQTAEAVGAVADLGNQVQAAAQGVTGQDLDAKLNAAETPEEISQIMQEAGLGS